MPNLQDVFAELSGPRLNWITGTVSAVTGGYVTISYLGGLIERCGYLDQYTPVVGDFVHGLSLEGQGVLILGSTNNGAPGGLPDPVQQTPVIITPASFSTLANGQWQPGLTQAPGNYAAFFYGTIPVIANLQSVEIELTGINGGPPEFVKHNTLNSAGAGIIDIVPGNSWKPATPVLAWWSLPIGWGKDLMNGIIKGFAISSSGQTGTYTGTGRVRFTPLAVTI